MATFENPLGLDSEELIMAEHPTDEAPVIVDDEDDIVEVVDDGSPDNAA